MPVSTFPDFIDALVAALQLRAGLAGVSIYSGPVTPEDLGQESIELAEDVEIEQSRASMGSTEMEESYSVPGSILVAAPIAPKSDMATTINTATKAVRDRAFAILHEVVDELAGNDEMTNTVRDVVMERLSFHQGAAPEGQLGRIAWVEFSMKVEARVTP